MDFTATAAAAAATAIATAACEWTKRTTGARDQTFDRNFAPTVDGSDASEHGGASEHKCSICLEDLPLKDDPRQRRLARIAWSRHTRIQGIDQTWFTCMPVQGAGTVMRGADTAKVTKVAEWTGCCGICVCEGCMSKYLSIQITDGNFEPRCPGQCRRCLTDAEARKFVGADLMQKLENRRAVSRNPRLRECSQCAHLTAGSAMSPDMKCEACEAEFCFHHDQLHSGIPCRVYMNQNASRHCDLSLGPARSEWKTRMKIRATTVACPQCRARVEKSGGCNKVTCICGASFCWKCGRAHGPGHGKFFSLRCRSVSIVAKKAAIVVSAPVLAAAVLPVAAIWIPCYLTGTYVRKKMRLRKKMDICTGLAQEERANERNISAQRKMKKMELKKARDRAKAEAKAETKAEAKAEARRRSM